MLPIPHARFDSASSTRKVRAADRLALGHTSVAITLDRYSQVIPTLQEDAVRRLDEVLRVAPRLGVRTGVRRNPRPRKSPDSRSESGLDEEFGTAYRNRGKPPVESG
jgi:hypothetical protein